MTFDALVDTRVQGPSAYKLIMICIPIMARDTAEAQEKMAQAASQADIMEIRLDVMKDFDLESMLASSPRPVLVTYRSKREGGKGTADYVTRTRYLMHAIEAGAHLVDVEYRLPLDFRHKLLQKRGSSGLVISVHLLNGTPSKETLEGFLRKMTATGADIVKIVTRARAWEDNLRVLELIPMARDLGTRIIAFSMGPMGRISRIFSPLMGGYLTFASLEQGQESASGQIPARDMKKIMDMISS